MTTATATAPTEATATGQPGTHHLICRNCSWPGPIALCGTDLSGDHG